MVLTTAPGLEATVEHEARALGLRDLAPQAGGVLARGSWTDVWRANLHLRCVTRVLVRVGGFHAVHLAQLDKRAGRIDWPALIPANTPIRVEATCRKSKIYHSKAASERVANAITAAIGPPSPSPSTKDPLRILARLDADWCDISLDTSGDLLHKRGAKPHVGKAPLRETLAAAFLFACGFTGDEPVLDPMCGSGTLVLEAADIAGGLPAGRRRAFAMERLVAFDPTMARLRHAATPATGSPDPTVRFFGSDRDAAAIRLARDNADAGGLSPVVNLARLPVSELAPPPSLGGEPGLVLVNPPYGGRLGDPRALRALYQRFGQVMRERFCAWRVGLITSEPALAKATGLPFSGPPSPPVPHGALRIQLYQTKALE